MPRSKDGQTFIAGVLPTITVNNKKYFVDGRMKQLRNIDDFNDNFEDIEYDEETWNSLSEKDKKIIVFEFHGYNFE